MRWLLWWRLGLEGGLGVGKVFPSLGEFGSQPWLPSGWGSLTYRVMEQQDVRVRLTVAVGKSGPLLYFTLGQNFQGSTRVPVRNIPAGFGYSRPRRRGSASRW